MTYSNTQTTDLTVTRVRHTTVGRRLLQVARTEFLTPHLLRVVLTGDALEGFTSLSFDDHCKLFFPAPGEEHPAMPELGPNGPVYPEGVPRPTMRDYTPRHFDPQTRELSIDFVLHEAGPATTWARQARPGHYLGIGGPRGSFVIPREFDWHLLIGDETALPAIARRLEELPAGKRAIVVVEVRAEDARVRFETQADLHEVWCVAGKRTLLQAVRDLELPGVGEGYAWGAGESVAMREVRQHLVTEGALPKSRMRLSAYWKRGEIAVHESLDD